MNIAILSRYPFPYGLAASNRILTYSKGLVSNGALVTVYIPFPTDNIKNSIKKSATGEFDGINYCYTSGRYKSKIKLFRAISVITRYRKIIGYFTLFIEIIKRNFKNKIDFIFISHDSILFLFFFSNVAKLLKAKVIFIFDEYPTPIRHKLKTKIPKIKIYCYKFVLKKIDAYISISENLKEFYTNICNKRTFILAGIIDNSFFDKTYIKNETDYEEKYLCYMGNMELAKDNVDLIVNAFGLIANKYKELKLYLYGDPNPRDFNKLKLLINNLSLNNRVLFKGKVPFNEVPTILSHAYILVTSQPNTVRASGGFPTKLGEYLSAGVPVILTDVGENTKEIKDNIHAFFVPPNNVDLYAKKIEFIIKNYSYAKLVANNGRNYIKEKFSAKVKTEELISFLNSL